MIPSDALSPLFVPDVVEVRRTVAVSRPGDIVKMAADAVKAARDMVMVCMDISGGSQGGRRLRIRCGF
ncbi:hypothetical protein GLI01_23310 [Gluconacetobacter liquefaciens]|nr:hypothetical protein GLI01_23310 [Gluconacetobacter liquefaciens]